jgi:hypothetical protein
MQISNICVRGLCTFREAKLSEKPRDSIYQPNNDIKLLSITNFYNPGPTDHLRCVRGDDWHVGNTSMDEGSGDPDDKEESDSCMVISDPVASLLKCDS